jgi:tellurite resistance protein
VLLAEECWLQKSSHRAAFAVHRTADGCSGRITSVTRVRRLPPNIFAIPFGLAGLSEAWVVAGDFDLCPSWVGNTLLILSAAVWVLTVVLYALNIAHVRTDIFDNVFAPFLSLIFITPMLLTADGLASRSHDAATVLVDIFLVLTILYGGWLTAQWMYAPLEWDKIHPGYFLPTVAGGLVASAAATAVGQRRLGEFMFGFGFICWLLLGSILLNRLFIRPLLPAALLPTYAIEVAPPAVASIAYFELNGGRIDAFAAVLAGYGVLMVAVQLYLLPAFVKLKFAVSTWAFTFAWAAVATTALIWIQADLPAGHRALSYLVLAAITLFIGGVAVRTVVALRRNQLLPARPPAQVT